MGLSPASSRGGGSGTVTSVTAGDTSVTVAGTAADPTVAVATAGVTAAKMGSGAAAAGRVATADGAGAVSYSPVTGVYSRQSAVFDGVNSTSAFNLIQAVIAAGSIGATGRILALVEGDFFNNSGGARTCLFELLLGATTLWADTANVPASAAHRAFSWTVTLANDGATNVQSAGGVIALSDAGAPASGLGTLAGTPFFITTIRGVAAVDTTLATTLTLRATFGTASASLELKGSACTLLFA